MKAIAAFAIGAIVLLAAVYAIVLALTRDD